MKKLTTSQALITGFLGASLLAAIAASTYTVTVDSTGVIKYPLNFAAANGLGGGGGTTNLPVGQIITNLVDYGTLTVHNGSTASYWTWNDDSADGSLALSHSGFRLLKIDPNGQLIGQNRDSFPGGFMFLNSSVDTNGNASFNGSLAGGSLNIASGALTVDGSGNLVSIAGIASSTITNMQDIANPGIVTAGEGGEYTSSGTSLGSLASLTSANSFNSLNTFQSGIASTRSNLLAPTSFTFPNTTVNWTNPLPVNIQVYINNGTVTGTAIKKNGTTIFSSVTGDATIGLQPGEFFSETYTVGTPTGLYSPF